MKLPKFKYTYVDDFILTFLKRKSVLHLGCVGVFLTEGQNACLHVNIAKISNDLWGIDSDSQGLEKVKMWLPEDGDHIRYIHGDVEEISTLNIKRKFEVILVGSIIEHLSNPGRMLSHLNGLLDKDGRVLLITPHAFGLMQYIRVALYRKEAVHPQHTCWFSVSVLSELCSRYDLVPVEWYTGYGYRNPCIKVKIERALGVPFFKLFPHLGGSLIGVFKAKDKR